MPGENLDYLIHGCPQMDHDARKMVKVSFSQLKLHQLILLCRGIFSTGSTGALAPAIFGHFSRVGKNFG